MKLSDQTRAIIAAALSLLVIMGWSLLMRTSQPAPTPPAAPATAPAAAPAPAAPATPGEAAVEAARSAPLVAESETTVVIESELYRVELSNRGAVVRSWQLKKFNDHSDPPRTLDLVHAEAAAQTGGWPFSLQLGDAQLEAAANDGLYTVKTVPEAAGHGALVAPAEVEFQWSDGALEVTKRLKFDETYVAELETTVRHNGRPVDARVAWRGGFGDATGVSRAQQVLVFSGRGGSITFLAADEVGVPEQRATPAEVPGTFDAVGISDLYFAAAFLPAAEPGQAPPATLTLWARQAQREVRQGEATRTEAFPEMAAGVAGGGPLLLRVFAGPKDLDLLKAMRPPLDELVRFGWTKVIAEPLFYTLRWLYGYVPNYGWAIVILTVAINTLLYPLKLKSWRSMQRMQKVAPEIKAIQERYKKYSMRDPRKQEMNKEVMAVYSREKINPFGSCLPMMAQLPIWWALYSMLTVTIELRHAPWIGWIRDLSAADPYYILPVTMGLLMWGAQKMMPTTITDPAQARMMTLMPLLFGGMFVVFPVSSGLVLYILTSNVVAIGQQWYLNRTSPIKPPAAAKGKKK